MGTLKKYKPKSHNVTKLRNYLEKLSKETKKKILN